MTILEFIGSAALGAVLMGLANWRAWRKYYEGKEEGSRKR